MAGAEESSKMGGFTEEEMDVLEKKLQKTFVGAAITQAVDADMREWLKEYMTERMTDSVRSLFSNMAVRPYFVEYFLQEAMGKIVADVSNVIKPLQLEGKEEENSNLSSTVARNMGRYLGTQMARTLDNGNSMKVMELQKEVMKDSLPTMIEEVVNAFDRITKHYADNLGQTLQTEGVTQMGHEYAAQMLEALGHHRIGELDKEILLMYVKDLWNLDMLAKVIGEQRTEEMRSELIAKLEKMEKAPDMERMIIRTVISELGRAQGAQMGNKLGGKLIELLKGVIGKDPKEDLSPEKEMLSFVLSNEMAMARVEVLGNVMMTEWGRDLVKISLMRLIKEVGLSKTNEIKSNLLKKFVKDQGWHMIHEMVKTAGVKWEEMGKILVRKSAIEMASAEESRKKLLLKVLKGGTEILGGHEILDFLWAVATRIGRISLEVEKAALWNIADKSPKDIIDDEPEEPTNVRALSTVSSGPALSRRIHGQMGGIHLPVPSVSSLGRDTTTFFCLPLVMMVLLAMFALFKLKMGKW